MIRRRYRFYGRVQHVGFRFIASRTARSLGLTGFVMNNHDGSVSMEAQGLRSDIAQLIARLQDDFYIRIDEMEVEDIPTQNLESGFEGPDGAFL